MGILNLLARSLLCFTVTQIILSILFSDIRLCHAGCFIGNSRGIRTEIGDNTYRTLSFNINSFV